MSVVTIITAPPQIAATLFALGDVQPSRQGRSRFSGSLQTIGAVGTGTRKGPMRYPARSFPAARFSSLLAAAIMVAAAYGPAAHAIEPCAPEPNFKAAQGHWYYQVDRATKRKCWFLGQPGSKI